MCCNGVCAYAMFMGFLQCTLERDCRDIGDVKLMLRIMDELLQFTPLFAWVVQQSPTLRHSLTRTICHCNNGNLPRNDIKRAFGEHALALSSNDEVEHWLAKDAELEKALCNSVRKLARVQETLYGTVMQLKCAKDRINRLKGGREDAQRLSRELKEAKQELDGQGELEEEEKEGWPGRRAD